MVRVAELVVQAGPMDSDRLDCFSDSLILSTSSFGVFSYLEVFDLFFEETIIWRPFSRKPMEESLNGKYTITHVISAWNRKEYHCMDVTVWEKFRNLFLVINFPQRWPRKRLLSWTLCCLPTFTEFWRNIRQCGKLCAPLRFVTLDLIPAQILALLHCLMCNLPYPLSC